MKLDRRIQDAKVSLLYRCCRRGFRSGRVEDGADPLLWILREHLVLPPRVAARTISKARRDSLQDRRPCRPLRDGGSVLQQAQREVERFGLQGTSFELDLEFLRADLASPHLARGGVLDAVDQMMSHLGHLSQALPVLASSARAECRRWLPGRGLRAMALGIVVALGVAGVGRAWGAATRPVARIGADVHGHQRTLNDLLGREAVCGEDLEVEILATYQALFAAAPKGGARRRQIREEWAAYLRRDRT